MTRILQWFAIPSSSGPHFVKEESEKASLKLSVKIAKIVESSPIISWQIEGGKLEAVTDFRFLGSKITADGDCCHKIRRRLLLGRKAMTNPDSILKSRDIIFLTKIHIVKTMVFPTVLYRSESWPIKKAERQRIDTFELWCWRRLLESLGLQGNKTSQSQRKSTLNTHWKD